MYQINCRAGQLTRLRSLACKWYQYSMVMVMLSVIRVANAMFLQQYQTVDRNWFCPFGDN